MSQYKLYDDISLYFVTNTITHWYPVFIDEHYFSVVTKSLEHCISNRDFKIHAYVIMLNHIHLIISTSQNGRYLSNVMRDFKRFTSKKITRLLFRDNRQTPLNIFSNKAQNDRRGNHFMVWKTGFHPKAIFSDQFLQQKISYIHMNPVKKGYVSEPTHWYYSSARNYADCRDVALDVDLVK